MNKETFMKELATKIGDLPKNEYDAVLSYYQETIDDCIEDGMDEEKAIANLEDIDTIVKQIHEENIPETIPQGTNQNSKANKTWKTIITVFISPFLFTAVALIFTFGLLLFTLFLIPCSLLLGLGLSAIISIIASPFYFFSNFYKTILLIGISFTAAGSSIYLYYSIQSLYEKLRTVLKQIYDFGINIVKKGWSL